MANRPALMTQADAARLFKASRQAGYERVRVVSHPDGRMEVVAEMADQTRQATERRCEWDDVLK